VVTAEGGAGSTATSPSGVGLVFNPALAGFVGAHRDALDFLEISPERFWHDRGPAWGQRSDRYEEIPEAVAQFEEARGDLPLLAHGVGLSIATPGPLDQGHVEQIARWGHRYGFAWFSEHLAYMRLGPEAGWRGIGVMIPPVYDVAVLEDLEVKVRQVRDILGLEVLLENAVDYTPVQDADLEEAEFLRALAFRTSARLLLDLHNLHTNAVNHGGDALAVVDALDLTLVHEIHIAGGESLAGQWTDAHSGRCEPEVWLLLEHVLSRPNAVRAVTFEVDESYATRMDAGAVLDELARARSIWNASLAGRGRHVA
jgi:uncharacterized protein (UPF0276 family)